uniref:Astacin domain-containing protein n=1 Tax=Strongyloides papillosus TaxID=174720 RepID=A0A0N5B8U1_STREA
MSSVKITTNNELDDNYRIKKSIIRYKRSKWVLPIKYHISQKLNVSVIKQAIKVVEEETCVTFNESNKHIRIKRGINFKKHHSSCHSYVGMRRIKKKYLYCFQKMALEIKHKNDTSVTGLNICGNTKTPIIVTSEGTSVLVLWYGKKDDHSFNLTYQEIDDKKN